MIYKLVCVFLCQLPEKLIRPLNKLATTHPKTRMPELTTQEQIERREFRRQLRIYRKSLKQTLGTTRFTNFTWEENCRMRATNPNLKCIYATPIQIAARVPLDTNVFVLEMNNDQDKIMGIGLVRNHPIAGKYAVHSKCNYNRYVYAGKWRIDREDMNPEEQDVLRLLEALCFAGINHSKRGQGITSFPTKLLYKSEQSGLNLMDFVRDMFKMRMGK